MDDDPGWWTDKSLKKINLNPELLQKGENKVQLKCDYNETHLGLEIIYLLGDFGVKVKKTKTTLIQPVKSLKLGDWVKQGLPFYSGSVTYHKTIIPDLKKGKRLFIQIPEYCGTAVRILVNNKECGIIAWPPNELDITDFLPKSSNKQVELGIEVISHRRNSHGPLHRSKKRHQWTGPAEYIGSGKEWTDNYQLVPCGLIKFPKLILKKKS